MAEAGFGPARRGLVQFAQRLPNLNLGEPVLYNLDSICLI